MKKALNYRYSLLPVYLSVYLFLRLSVCLSFVVLLKFVCLLLSFLSHVCLFVFVTVFSVRFWSVPWMTSWCPWSRTWPSSVASSSPYYQTVRGSLMKIALSSRKNTSCFVCLSVCILLSFFFFLYLSLSSDISGLSFSLSVYLYSLYVSHSLFINIFPMFVLAIGYECPHLEKNWLKHKTLYIDGLVIVYGWVLS
jgi:hypothetical protein